MSKELPSLSDYEEASAKLDARMKARRYIDSKGERRYVKETLRGLRNHSIAALAGVAFIAAGLTYVGSRSGEQRAKTDNETVESIQKERKKKNESPSYRRALGEDTRPYFSNGAELEGN